MSDTTSQEMQLELRKAMAMLIRLFSIGQTFHDLTQLLEYSPHNRNPFVEVISKTIKQETQEDFRLNRFLGLSVTTSYAVGLTRSEAGWNLSNGQREAHGKLFGKLYLDPYISTLPPSLMHIHSTLMKMRHGMAAHSDLSRAQLGMSFDGDRGHYLTLGRSAPPDANAPKAEDFPSSQGSFFTQRGDLRGNFSLMRIFS